MLAAWLAFIFKLWLALFTEGTLDVAAFAVHLAKVEELGVVGAYQVTGTFNNHFNRPPFISHFLKVLGWLNAEAAASSPTRPRNGDIGSSCDASRPSRYNAPHEKG